MQIIGSMKVAGWVSIFSALLTIPVLIFSIYTMFLEQSLLLIMLVSLVNIAYVSMLIIMFMNFRFLLNKYVEETKLDTFITIIIWANIIFTTLNVFTFILPNIETWTSIASIVLLVPYGIYFAIFGLKILNLDNALFGWKTSFSIITILTGVTLATVVLTPIGLILSMIADIIMAVIFFKAQKVLNKHFNVEKAAID